MSRKDNDYDDLTVIDQIGSKRQSFLRENLQIRTYLDLATITIEEIQTQLCAQNKSVARDKIETWIEEAGKLAREGDGDAEPIPVDAELAVGKVIKQPTAPKKAGAWKDYASFMVYFESREIDGAQEKRIKVSHLEEDKSNVWAELTAEHFLWMLNQAGEGLVHTPQTVEEETKEAPPEGKAKVKVTQVKLFQPPDAKEPLVTSTGHSNPAQENISAGDPFSLEVLFSLGGEAAKFIARQEAAYTVQAVANEIKSKTGINLGGIEPEVLIEGTFDYSVRLPEMILDPGVHQLWAMVRILATNTIPNFLEGPTVMAE
ncbi:MAG: hypothetical protein DHS20C20_23510 [Ardenticatenaceae bacterium]|nr:MAG: hypothetical protein DHS20C20_23510 [Ardenticatenaceae bacterium]